MVEPKQIDEVLSRYLRLQTFPVAIRMCESEEELPEGVRIPERDLGLTVSLCHAIALARRYGWVMALDKNQACYVPSLSLGLLSLLPDIADGSYQASLGMRGMSQEEAAADIANMPKFEFGKYQYALLAPLHRTTFEPQVILVYGNPAQIGLLLAGYLSGTGKKGLEVTLKSGGCCPIHITQTIQTGEATFSLLSAAERVISHAQDYDCVFSLPFSKVEPTLQGLESGYKGGVHRYPLPGFLRYSSQLPPPVVKMRTHFLGEDT